MDASVDAVPDARIQNEDDTLARQQLDSELLASAAATFLPASRLSSVSSSSSSTSSSSSHTSSQSNSSAQVLEEEEDTEEDGRADSSSRKHETTTGRQWWLIVTLVFSIIIAVAYVITQQPISQAISDKILISFQRPIEKGCGWADRRLIYLSQLHPPLANNTPCVPVLCPNTLSFLQHPDPYAVLGLSSPSFGRASPSKRDIQRAYRTLAMLYHPDKSASYLSPYLATPIMAIFTVAVEKLLHAETQMDLDFQWINEWGRRDFAESIRAPIEQRGEVDLWTVLTKIKVRDLRMIRFDGL